MKDNLKVIIYFSLFVVFLILAFWGYNVLSENKLVGENIAKSYITKENDNDKMELKEFSLTLENGEKISSIDLLDGKPLIINIWTSWCAYCDIEMEYFNEVYIKEKDNVILVMINATGDRDSKERAKEYVSSKGYSFNIYYDLELESLNSLGVYSYPTTIFVDKNGYIDSKVTGVISRELLNRKIQSLK